MAKTDMQVKFLQGLQASLPKSGNAGSFYLTTDTDRLYVGKADGSLALLNQVINIIATQAELPKAGAASLNDFYYIKEGNVLAFYNGTSWVQINPDKFYTLVENAAVLSVDAASNVATIALEIADTAGKKVSGQAKIKAGSDNVSIVKDADGAISIAVEAPDTVDFSIGTKDEGTTNTATITLNKQIGSQAAAEDSAITLKGNDFVTVESDAAGNVTVNGKDQTVTDAALDFDANGNLGLTISQNGKQVVASTEVTPIIKIGTEDEQIKFVSGAADLSVYTMAEIDAKLATLESKAEAMSYRGTIAAYSELASKTPENGDVYMLSAADGEYEQGDLFIYNGTTSSWDYVPAGDDAEKDTTYTFTAVGNAVNKLSVAELAEHKASIAVQSGDMITAEGVVAEGSNDLVVTVKHNTVTINDPEKGSTTQTAKNELTFDAVASVERDAYGHVTKVTTNEIKVVDTHNVLSDVKMAVAAGTNAATIATTVEMTDGNKTSNAVEFNSESLKVTADATNAKVNVELVWETF